MKDRSYTRRLRATISLCLLLGWSFAPALAQTERTKDPNGGTTSSDQGLDFLSQVLRAAAKAKQDAEARRKAAEEASGAADTVPADQAVKDTGPTTEPAQEPATPPTVPRQPKPAERPAVRTSPRPIVVDLVPRPKPSVIASPSVPSEATAREPAIKAVIVTPVENSARTAPAGSRMWAWMIVLAILSLVAATGYFARRFFFAVAPFPGARAWPDPGITSEPVFESPGLTLTLMIAPRGFVTELEYPDTGRAP